MKINTQDARDFSEASERYTGAEVRVWVHNLSDEIDRLREALQRAKNSLVAFKFMPSEGNAWEEHDDENLAAVNAALGFEAKPRALREHIASAKCWCEPTTEYTDPQTGSSVLLHRAAN